MALRYWLLRAKLTPVVVNMCVVSDVKLQGNPSYRRPDSSEGTQPAWKVFELLTDRSKTYKIRSEVTDVNFQGDKANRLSYWATVSRFCRLCLLWTQTGPVYTVWGKRALLWVGLRGLWLYAWRKHRLCA